MTTTFRPLGPNVVEVVCTKNLQPVRVSTDSYTFVAKSRYRWMRWLQVQAWRFLQRQGALREYMEKIEVVHVRIVDDPDLLEVIHQAALEVWDKTNEPPRVVYIGLSEVRELKMHPEGFRSGIVGPVDIPVSLARAYPFKGGPPGLTPTMRVHNLTAYLVPWMQGVLVLP